MAEYESRRIIDLLDDIAEGKVVLPSMQRDFVWSKEKIYALFDSLMRNYPIGTFLFWDLKKEEFDKYVFNEFIQDYVEQKYNNPHGKRAQKELSEYVAVLDGQQRITSLLMGIRGKYSAHIKGRYWDDPNSFIDQYLCLNLLFEPKDEEEDYNFMFIDEDKVGKFSEDNNSYWMKVSDILDLHNDKWFNYMTDLAISNPGLVSQEQISAGTNMIHRIRQAINETKNVNYYPASNIPLTKIVEIFVRVNDGGQKLDASDLMLSVASGINADEDIHGKIRDAIIDIITASSSEDPLKVDKEMVLTAGLMFTNAESLSLKKESSYSKQQMQLILEHWDSIIEAMVNAVDFIEYIGFKCSKLTSKNLIYPVAYYFYKNNLSSSHKESTKKRAKCDKAFIRQWLLRAMINSLFSDSTGKTLLDLRRIIDKSTKQYFPLDDIMQATLRKEHFVTEEQIDEEILEWKYPDGRIIPLLKDLAKDDSGTVYQADHIWPKNYLTQSKKFKNAYPAATPEIQSFYKSECHKLSNIQILQPLVNQEKSDTLFGEWLDRVHPNKHDYYYERNLIPIRDSYDFQTFEVFLSDRRTLLKERIKKAYPDSFEEILINYNL